jgi:hypothetical protein
MVVRAAFVLGGIAGWQYQINTQRLCALPMSRRSVAVRRRVQSPTALSAPLEVSSEAKGCAGDETEKESKSDVCTGCGLAGGPMSGCDGTGRIVGGLGAIVDWWPIKAYRPCPELTKAKKPYQRSGQSLDEIAFGRLDSERTVE